MGVYDDAGRYAAEADPVAFLGRILAETPRTDLTFHDWLDPRTSPLPNSPDRVADLLAILNDPLCPEKPWLLGIELQSRPGQKKLAVTLETTGIFTARATHGADSSGEYTVTSAIVHLTGRPPREAIDARLGKYGTYHRPVPWNIAFDRAKTVLDRVAAGTLSWGMLFWVPLMRGADTKRIAERWRDQVAELVPDPERRRQLGNVALVFAELAGRYLLWEQVLGGWQMTESPLVNSWIRQGVERAEVRLSQHFVLSLLTAKFPDHITEELRLMIEQQSSPATLETWFQAALGAATYADFLRELRG